MGARLALENEKYLQSGAQMEIYSDFLHTFLPHPNTGQITRKTNVDAVKMAIHNLIMTNKYERLRNPKFGGNISKYLFENGSPALYGVIKADIKDIIRTYEPRANVLDVNVSGDLEAHQLYITITFNVVTSQKPERINLTLHRVR